MDQELVVLMQDEGDRKARIEKFVKLAADESNRGKVLEEIRGVYAQWVKEVSEYALGGKRTNIFGTSSVK